MKKIPLLTFLGIIFSSAALHAAYYLNEDFSTYTDGNLVGQKGWAIQGSPTSNPIQVSGGKVVMTGNSADNQDAKKNFDFVASAGSTFYYGFQMQVTGPGVNNAGFTSSYFSGILDKTSPTAFIDSRIGFYNIDGSIYQISARVNGQSANPFTQASDILTFGTDLITVLVSFTYGDGGSTLDSLNLWVNPFSSSEPADLMLQNTGTAITPGGFQSLILSQFSFSSDVLITKLAAADTFEEVFTATAVPEPSVTLLIMLGAGFWGVTALRRRLSKSV